MYRTLIASVSGRICTSTDGKNLISIGNANINAGDYVWTDGKCVYGNLQEGGGPQILSIIGGVPLIDNDGGKYVNRQGIIKEIDCTNPDGYVYANNDIDVVLSSSSVLDAEISADAEPEIYTIRKKSVLYDVTYSHKFKIPKYFFVGYNNSTSSSSSYSDEANPENNKTSSSSSPEGWITEPFLYDNCLEDSQTIEKIDILKGDKIMRSISAEHLISIANNRCMYIMEKASCLESGGITYPPGRTRPPSMINETMISVKSAKIDCNGNYELIMAATCIGVSTIWRHVITSRWNHDAYDYERHYDAQWLQFHIAKVNTMHTVRHQKNISYTNDNGQFWVFGSATYSAYIKITANRTEVIKEIAYVESQDSSAAPNGFIGNMRLGEIKNGNVPYVQPGPYGYWDYDSGDCFGWNWNWHQPTEVRYGYYHYDYLVFPAAVMIDALTSNNTRIMVQDSLTAVCTIDADDSDNTHAIYDGDTLVTKDIIFCATQNLCGCRLNDDDEHPLYIIGIHGKGYYIVQDGKVIDQGDGLQNYRLRYMKNLSTFKSALGG